MKCKHTAAERSPVDKNNEETSSRLQCNLQNRHLCFRMGVKKPPKPKGCGPETQVSHAQKPGSCVTAGRCYYCVSLCSRHSALCRGRPSVWSPISPRSLSKLWFFFQTHPSKWGFPGKAPRLTRCLRLSGDTCTLPKRMLRCSFVFGRAQKQGCLHWDALSWCCTDLWRFQPALFWKAAPLLTQKLDGAQREMLEIIKRKRTCLAAGLLSSFTTNIFIFMYTLF